METGNAVHLPVYMTEDYRPDNRHGRLQRRHTARYYAHRVKESLTTQVVKTFCTVFLFLLFVLGMIAFILFLSLRPHRPRFHIEDFQVPGLNLNQPTGFSNVVMKFNVSIRNPNRKISVHYYSVAAAVYYVDQPLGGSTVVTEPFDQEPKTTIPLYKELGGETLTVTSQRWAEFLKDRSDGSVVFMLEITSLMKFKVYTWDTRHHRMHAKCDVAVGANGLILDSYKDRRCPVYFT